MRHSTIDQNRFSSHRGSNRLQTLLLLAFMTTYAGYLGWLLWGLDGVWTVAIMGAFLLFFSPGISSRWVLRMYGARPLHYNQTPQYHQLMRVLTQRSGLSHIPSLWWVPSRMVNAFAVGRKNDSAIAMTQGLLQTLSPRELAGVLAHETAHIVHDDLFVMGLADAISRITSAMSFTGLLLLVFSLPQIFFGGHVNWLPLLLLAAAPQISLLAQLGLSRTREFDADLTAAQLTDDPEGLAMALDKLERIQRQGFRRIFLPGQGVPEPSWLRTHPTSEERIKRLLDLKRPAQPWAHDLSFEPLVLQHSRLHRPPRGGLWGYWY